MNIRDSLRQSIIVWLGDAYRPDLPTNPDYIDDAQVERLVDQLLLSLLTCTRCGYQWYPRTPNLPKVCPNPKCKSPYWNKVRRKEVR